MLTIQTPLQSLFFMPHNVCTRVVVCALLLCITVSMYAYSRCVENITSDLLSAAGPQGRRLLLFCLSGDKVFLSGVVISEGHLPPQRLNSLNSPRAHKRHADVCNRPPIPIVWLKLAIKIFRQNKCIQTKIKERNYTFKSLTSMCWILKVLVVFIKPAPVSVPCVAQFYYRRRSCIMFYGSTFL